MKKLQLILVMLILFSAYTVAQKVSGVVYYVDQPAKNAVIEVEKDNVKVKTDENGYFSIDVSIDAEIIISYKGIELKSAFNGVDAYNEFVLIPKENKFARLIEKEPTLAKCELYLEQFSQGKHIETVKIELEKQMFIAAYDNAVSSYNLVPLYAYLKDFPSGKYADKAAKTIDIVSWQKAKSEDTVDAYSSYLEQFPDGEAVSLARERMAMLDK